MWAERLNDVGPGNFYVEGQFADYPPGYLYVLWLTGTISAAPGYVLLKLPAIVGDLALAWVAGIFAARIAPASLLERMPVRALATAAVLFNPAVIALSSVWGQVDVVPAVLVLASLLLLFAGPRSLHREIAAFLLFAVAFAMKPQSSFVFPVIGYVLYRRYLHRRARAEVIAGLLRIGFLGVLSLGVWAVSGLAFGMGPLALLRFYRDSASVYPVTSANAFNLWGAYGFWRPDTGNEAVAVAGIPALRFGMLLFVASAALVVWRAHRAIERGADLARVLLLSGAVTSLLAYTLLTRMHERYMFISLALLVPLVFSAPVRRTLVALSGLFILNLWYPFAFFNVQWQVEAFHYNPLFDWVFGGFENDTWQKKVYSLAVTGIALLLAWRGLYWVKDPDSEWAAPIGKPRTGRFRFRGSAEAPLSPPRPAEQPAATDSSGVLDDPGPALASDRALAAPRSLVRWVPAALVGLACLFWLVVLRGETKPAQNLNDSAFHLQMVRWAHGQISEGRVPLDGWYPYLSLGSSHFHHYQSLPHTLTAFAAHITGASDEHTFLWIQFVLLALWPVSVYVGARLLDWSRWTAVCAAIVSPLVVSAPGYGYEHGSYTWQGYGVYSQLWAMWLLPLSWGLTWRAVTRGHHYAAAAAATALTIACHFITGYLAILAVGVWVIVGAGLVRRASRAALTVAGSLLVASWVLVPLVGDTKWTTQSEFYKGTIFNDSYGARQVLEWLVTADLFDHERFPVLTLLVLVGVIVCLDRVRRDSRARALLGISGLSLLLFFGRPTLGRVLDLLPGFGDVQIHRFVIGVHLAGILLAGVGLGWLARTLYEEAARRLPARYAMVAGVGLVVLGVGLLEPAWSEHVSYHRQGVDLIREQQAADESDGRRLDALIGTVKARGDGRVYSGLRSNWGRDYRVGHVPVYAVLANRDVDAIGFTFRTIASLSTDVEAAFDETNPAHYEMLNIRYLILDGGREPPVRARLLGSSGRHSLWEVQTTGYLRVVDRAQPISASRKNLAAATLEFRSSRRPLEGIYPGIAFADEAGPPPTFAGPSPPDGAAGSVLEQRQNLEDGVLTASVAARRPAVALLKATYDRRWKATVDGLPATATMIAPSLVGVDVPAGQHAVEFRYDPYSKYPLLVAVGVLALLGLALAPSVGARLSARRTAARQARSHSA